MEKMTSRGCVNDPAPGKMLVCQVKTQSKKEGVMGGGRVKNPTVKRSIS